MYCVSCDRSHDEAIETSLIDFFGAGGTMNVAGSGDLYRQGQHLGGVRGGSYCHITLLVTTCYRNYGSTKYSGRCSGGRNSQRQLNIDRWG